MRWSSPLRLIGAKRAFNWPDASCTYRHSQPRDYLRLKFKCLCLTCVLVVLLAVPTFHPELHNIAEVHKIAVVDEISRTWLYRRWSSCTTTVIFSQVYYFTYLYTFGGKPPIIIYLYMFLDIYCLKLNATFGTRTSLEAVHWLEVVPQSPRIFYDKPVSVRTMRLKAELLLLFRIE